MKKKHWILLGLIALFCVGVPLAGMLIDFGEGTDDAAGTMIEQISNTPPPETQGFGFHPTEGQEPWLFVLQILIGLGIFFWALVALNKHHSNKK